VTTLAEAKAALKKAGHIHISEREADGSWEDCTWDSGLEWYRLVYDTRKPATHAEAQLLRKASGEPATGGSNMGDLARGIKARYGTTIPARISGFSNLKAALTPGKVAVIQGSMSAFGPDHPLSKYDRNFDGAHALVLANIGGVLLWCDPEAPTTADVPVQVTWTQVEKFVRAFSGQHVVGKVRLLPVPSVPTTGGAMSAIVKYLPGYTANIKPASNVRSAPLINTTTKLRTTGTAKEAVVLIGTVKGDVDPANGSTEWYMWWKNARYEYTAKDNILDLKSPGIVDDGIDQSDVDAAKAAGYASGKTDGIATGEVTGVAKEQARIKGVLGLK
jgi:hypothetical protein